MLSLFLLLLLLLLLLAALSSTYYSGTDVLGMTTKAVRSSDGSSYKLDGAKMWITNGTTDGTNTGDVFLVYARTGPGRQDVSMFIVEKVRGGLFPRVGHIMIRLKITSLFTVIDSYRTN